MSDDEWTVIESRTEYETGWYAGGFDLVRQPDGSTKRYYWAGLAPAVVVVALDGDEVVFIEQYRPAIRAHCLELPAGIVEPLDGASTGEDGWHRFTESGRESYEEAGVRELREEAGYAAGEVTLIETFWCATGVLRHRRGVVVAEDLTHVGVDRDDNEFLEVTRLARADVLDAARDAPVNDATLEALLLAAEDGYL